MDGRTDYAMLLGVPVRIDKVCQACRPGWPIRGSRLASVGIACWIERSWTVNSHNFFLYRTLLAQGTSQVASDADERGHEACVPRRPGR